MEKTLETTPDAVHSKGIPSRSDVEDKLNTLGLNELPASIKELVLKAGFYGQRYGYFLRNYHNKEFESYYISAVECKYHG